MNSHKRVDSFLYCCKLETGGLFFGWFGIIGSLLSLLLFIAMIVGLSQDVITDDSLRNMGFIADSDEFNQDKIQIIKQGEKIIQIELERVFGFVNFFTRKLTVYAYYVHMFIFLMLTHFMLAEIC